MDEQRWPSEMSQAEINELMGIVPEENKPRVTPRPTQPTTSNGRVRYNWDAWTDGEYHELVRGRDFDVPISKMQVQCYRRAQDMDMVVKTEKVKDLGTGEIMSLGVMFGRSRGALEVAWAKMLEEPESDGADE